jgi:hypothetical protein
MKYAANVLTVEKLRKYLKEEKFGFNKKNFTFNVDGISHNFSQETLRLALDGNLMVKETNKDPIKIHVYLSNYNWNMNKHNLPVYEAPKPMIKNFTREEIMNDHKVSFIFQVMKDILNPDDYKYHLQFLNDNINGKKLLKTPIYQSGQGDGKDSISTYLMSGLFPEISGTLTSIKDFFENNSQLDDKRFVSISDGNLPKNQDEYNMYKNAVTSMQRQRDVKYEKKTLIKNEINLLFTTNERGKFYSEQNDRRMLFIPISSRYRNNREIWSDFHLYLSIPEVHEKLKFILANINTNIDCNYYSNEIAEKYKLRENVDVNSILSIIYIMITKKLKNWATPEPYNDTISNEDKFKLELFEKMGKINLEEYEVLEEYRSKKKTLLKNLPSNIYEFDFISECFMDKKYIVVDFKKFNEILSYKPAVSPEVFDYQKDVIDYIQFGEHNPLDNDEDTDNLSGDMESDENRSDNEIEVVNIDTGSNNFELIWGTADVFSKNSIKDNNRQFDYLNNPNKPASQLEKDEKGQVKRLKNTDFCLRNMLFEFDTISIEEQENLVTKSGIKPRRCVFSGSKSNHYIVELAENYCSSMDEYHYLWHYINNHYFNELADKACCNPNRLTRHPGGINIKTGKSAELRYISPFVLRINNIDEIFYHLRNKEEKTKKIKQKQQKQNGEFRGGVNYERLMNYLIQDKDFALVWNADSYPAGQRNRLKQHFVGVCNSCGMPGEEIESKIIDWLGDADGENSISSLIN